MNEHQTVFISYGAPDTEFATRLVAALESHGVRTWFFPRDKVPGQPLDEAMRVGVATYDRVLAICSESAFKRRGFMNELQQTFRREAREGGKSILLPVTIDDFLFSEPKTMDGGHFQEILDRTVADFREGLTDLALFDREVASVVRALKRAPAIVPTSQVTAQPGLAPVVAVEVGPLPDTTLPAPSSATASNAPVIVQVSASQSTSPLVIEYEEEAEGFFMRWDGQMRVIKGNEYKYIHRLYRIRIRNTSQEKTVRGVQVVILNLRGVESAHHAVLPAHRLRAMDSNTAEVNINPGATAYFDVASHDLEPELHAVDDLKFRYADVEKDSLPTDPETWLDFTLQAQGVDVPTAERRFRLLVDADNVAHLRAIGAPETTGIEPSFERRKPFEDDDYADTEYGFGGRIFRIGLRSLELNKPYPATVVVESTSGGIEGVLLERPLRFKDTGGGEKSIPYAPKACTFVDVLKYPMMGRGQPIMLYAQTPQYGDDVKLTKRFSLRLRITGGPRAVYMTLVFVPNILGFPELLTYEVE